MKQNKLFILIGLVFLIFIFCYINILSGIEQNAVVYRPDSYNSYGLKALRIFIGRYGYSLHPVKKFRRTSASGICIVITSDQSLTYHVKREISNWVKAGGTLIELAKFKPRFSHVVTDSAISPLPVSRSSRPGFDRLRYDLKSRLPYLTWENTIYGIYGVGRRYFIYKENVGRGVIVSWNDPDGLTNRCLRANPDHGVIFLRLLEQTGRSGPVDLIDLRYSRPRNPFSLRNIFNRYSLAIFFILSGIVLGLWKLASRFGRSRPMTLAKGRSRNEFVIFLAALFQQADLQEMVLDNLCRILLKTVLEITMLPPDTPSKDAIKHLEKITGTNYHALQTLIDSIETRRIYANLSRKSFLALASKIDRYRKELEDWNRFKISVLK